MVVFELSEQNAKKLVEDIGCLSASEHDQILECIKKDDIRYMENENGTFIKFNDIKMSTIQTIYDYVSSIRESQKMQYKGSILNVENKIRGYNEEESEGEKQEDKLGDKQEDKYDEKYYDKPESTVVTEKKYVTENWKKEVIMKMKNEVKQKYKKGTKAIESTI
tara:strand:+ start:1690 stop:2181 length:492 start_codon:yes stop_codon:yes gene_type:complete